MLIPLRGGPVLVGVLAVAAVLTPVRFSAGEAVVSATAECTTCCTKRDVLCVVCSKECTTVPDAYDHGTGACPSDGDPNVN